MAAKAAPKPTTRTARATMIMTGRGLTTLGWPCPTWQEDPTDREEPTPRGRSTPVRWDISSVGFGAAGDPVGFGCSETAGRSTVTGPREPAGAREFSRRGLIGVPTGGRSRLRIEVIFHLRHSPLIPTRLVQVAKLRLPHRTSQLPPDGNCGSKGLLHVAHPLWTLRRLRSTPTRSWNRMAGSTGSHRPLPVERLTARSHRSGTGPRRSRKKCEGWRARSDSRSE